MNVIYDNASDWLVVEGKDCGNCLGDTYNIEGSTAYNQVSTETSSRTYGNVQM